MLVKVKPNSKESKLIKENNHYIAYLKSQPEKGKANEELIKLFYKTYKKRIKILKGLKSRNKIISFS